MRLTIDTNCVIHSASQQGFAAEVDKLVDLARAGLVALSLTTAFEVDQERASDGNRGRNLEWLSQRPVIGRVPQPARFDYTRWGDGSVFASEETAAINTAIERIMLPEEYRVGNVDVGDPEYMRRWRKRVTDVQHLLAHHASGNDAFVTTDEDDILKKREALRAAAGIVVYSLPQAVQAIQDSSPERMH